MKQSRKILTYIAVFAALLLSLYLLLVLCATIPNASVKKQMRASGMFFVNADPYVFSDDGRYQNITDNYADQIWTNIGWHMGSGNPFLSSLDTKYYDNEKQESSAGLYRSVTRGLAANTDYTRYWHGTAGLIRLLHLFTDIHGIRNIGMVCLVLLLLKTFLTLCRNGYWDVGLCVLVSVGLVQFGNLRLSVEYMPCFLICFGLCPAFLRLEKQGDFYLNLLGILSGTLTAFFDFLTTETLTILFPLILVIVIRSRERRLGSPRQVLRMLLHCGLCWLLAYVGTFAVKWCAVSLVTDKNHLLAAMDSVGQRMNGMVKESDGVKVPGMIMAVGSNFTVLFEGTSRTEYCQVISNLTLIAVFVFFVYRVYRVRRKLRPGTGYILLLGSVVLLRYGVLANHAYLHSFFTYRALASTILAVLTAMLLNLYPGQKRG